MYQNISVYIFEGITIHRYSLIFQADYLIEDKGLSHKTSSHFPYDTKNHEIDFVRFNVHYPRRIPYYMLYHTTKVKTPLFGFIFLLHTYIFGHAVGHLKLVDRKTEQEDRIKEFLKK